MANLKGLFLGNMKVLEIKCGSQKAASPGKLLPFSPCFNLIMFYKARE